jgi:hypothetical protein
METKQVITALERIASEAIKIQPRTAGDENPLTAGPAIEQTLEEIPPGALLVELVEHPQLCGGQLAAENTFAMFGDIPVQVARHCSWKALGECGLPDLSRTRDEDHLFDQIASDLGHKVASERGHMPSL